MDLPRSSFREYDPSSHLRSLLRLSTESSSAISGGDAASVPALTDSGCPRVFDSSAQKSRVSNIFSSPGEPPATTSPLPHSSATMPEASSSKEKAHADGTVHLASPTITTSNSFEVLNNDADNQDFHEDDQAYKDTEVEVDVHQQSKSPDSQAMVVYTGPRTIQHPLGKPVGELLSKFHEAASRQQALQQKIAEVKVCYYKSSQCTILQSLRIYLRIVHRR